MIQGKYELPLLLLRAAVTDTTLRYDGYVDWEFLLDFGQKQDVMPILLRGIRRLGWDMPEALEKEFIKADDLAVAMEAAQFVAMHQMFAVFERKGIACVLLKGGLLRDLYPSPHLRTMGDIDILTDPFNPQENRLIMAELELKPEDKVIREISEYDVMTDNYVLPPFIQVEIHKRLIPAALHAQMGSTLAEMLERVVPLAGYSHIKRLTVQDNYIYLWAHLYKHFSTSGMGIRMLLDVWLYFKANQAELEKSPVEDRLAQMGILEFSHQIFRLCRLFFTPEEMGEISLAEEKIFLSGKLHDEIPMLVDVLKKFKGQSKMSLFLQIVFINRSRLAEYYPQLVRQPWLYPFYYAKRVIFVLRCRMPQLRQLFLFAFTQKGDELFREIRERWER